MGEFVTPVWMRVLAWVTATIIIVLNVKYLFDFVRERFFS
jgi:Mn2+/Fe2+ NRAMP family transporter